MYNTIKSFNEIDSSSFEEQLSKKIKEDIERKGKEYILGVDESEYKNYLINEYTVEPLTVYTETETIDKPDIRKELLEDRHFRGYQYETESYEFTVRYQYSGSAILFRVHPNPWTMTSAEIVVDNDSVSFSFKLYNKNPEEFVREKKSMFQRAFTNLEGTNAAANHWNKKLSGIVDTYFKKQKKKYLDENDFFAAINVKVNDDTKSVFTVPTVKKKIIPQPNIAKNKEFHPEPTMSKEMYEDILKVVYDAGRSMEKKPSLYQKKDEESLRDQFLLFLETRYESITATGETFNRNGKTDIMLKHATDGSNVFVAECKFWHGAVEFQKAISQLLGYLTWRDSKTALILFVRNTDFTNVLRTIREEVKNNDYYVKENGNRGESSFSYLFCLPQDKNKQIHLEIIAFHFDKLTNSVK
ncbi:hypothetical protein EZS27_010073 [termite gut metagenome]|uniref:Uncharacterized protein n=1 Tax=termite gut metagenome TaxID=433724 RepID=A0A5J4S8H8_9ZZZZ